MRYYLGLSIILFSSIILSGCTINGSSSKEVGGVLASDNSGGSWELKNKVNDKQTISGVDIFDLVIDPVDTERIYLGTKDKGIVVSKNGAENWEKMKFPGNKVYSIVINQFKPSNIYATGVFGQRGKIYKTEDYGIEWREVYTEPADGTVVTSMAMDKNNPLVLYAGTSNGIVIKSIDGGGTWRSVHIAEGAITKILFGGGSDQHIYFLVYESEVLVSDINGDNFRVVGENAKNAESKNGKIYSIAVSESDNGFLYVGTDNGIFRAYNAGTNLEEVVVLATVKGFPIRSIAINPGNSQEIIYSAAQAIYKSVDGGQTWATYQIDTGKLISKIVFNPSDVNMVYSGLRSF